MSNLGTPKGGGGRWLFCDNEEIHKKIGDAKKYLPRLDPPPPTRPDEGSGKDVARNAQGRTLAIAGLEVDVHEAVPSRGGRLRGVGGRPDHRAGGSWGKGGGHHGLQLHDGSG